MNCISTQTSKLRVDILWMTSRTMTEVLQIENEGSESPWTKEEFLRRLSQGNCIAMVAEHDDRVIGFMVFELYKTRLHLLNIAIAKGFRRRGVGSQLLNRLIGKLHPRRTCFWVEVRERNLPAQRFFRASGLRAVSVLRNFFDDTSPRMPT